MKYANKIAKALRVFNKARAELDKAAQDAFKEAGQITDVINSLHTRRSVVREYAAKAIKMRDRISLFIVGN